MSPEPSARPSQPWARYRENLARQLIGISRDLQIHVRDSLAGDCGFGGLRPSFGPFLSLLWDQGRPLTAIAGELAISPQACSQLANLVEAAGYLERRSHPEDGRSKLVVLTPRGRALVEEGVRIILESESRYRAIVGAAPYRRFTRALSDLFQGLGLPTHSDPTLTARARESVGVLPLITVRIERQLMEATIARGHAGLKMAYGQVLPFIGPEGGRIHEIARVQGVSRQAISAISQELEGLGYLQRQPDPRDRRSVELRLTDRGEALIRDSVAALDELVGLFRAKLGTKRLAELERVAHDLYDGLRLEAEIFEISSGSKPTKRAGHDIQQLASRLRHRLGSGEAARLAELLEPRLEGRKK